MAIDGAVETSGAVLRRDQFGDAAHDVTFADGFGKIQWNVVARLLIRCSTKSNHESFRSCQEITDGSRR